MIDTIDRETLIRGLASSVSPAVMPAALVRACVATMRRLADGQPVSPSSVAGALSVPEGDIEGHWKMLGSYGMAQFDPEGHVTGMILSLSSTPHRFLVHGHQLYTWCALDTLFMPAVLRTGATIESPCPVTGATVRLRASPSSIDMADPASTVVSVVVAGTTPGITAACGPDLVGATGALLPERVVPGVGGRRQAVAGRAARRLCAIAGKCLRAGAAGLGRAVPAPPCS